MAVSPISESQYHLLCTNFFQYHLVIRNQNTHFTLKFVHTLSQLYNTDNVASGDSSLFTSTLDHPKYLILLGGRVFNFRQFSCKSCMERMGIILKFLTCIQK
jgi:hypothetical protein